MARFGPTVAFAAVLCLFAARATRAGQDASVPAVTPGGTSAAEPTPTASPASTPDGGTAAGETLVIEAVRSDADLPATASRERIDLAAFAVRAISTGEVLERLAGVDVVAYGGAGQGRFVRIRGSSPAQVLVLVDGVRVNPLTGGGADLDAIPIELLERVEVSRSAGAARFGADALGGVVSFRSDPAAKGAAVLVTANSLGGMRSAVSTALRPGGGWSGDLTVRQEHVADRFRYRDGLRDETRTRENVGSEAVGLSTGLQGPLGRGALTARLWGTMLDGGAPGLSEHPTPHAQRADERAALALRWEGDGGWSFELSERYEALRYRNDQAMLGAPPVRAASRGNATQGAALARFGAGAATFTVGGDARDERLRDLFAGHHARQVGGVHGAVHLRSGGDGAKGSSRFEADAALRVEAVALEGRIDGGTGVTPLPSAGLAWHRGLWTVRAHGSRGYRIPTFTELYLPNLETYGGNPALRPEDAWSGDLGVVARARLGNVSGRAEATAFGTILRDGIVFAPVSTFHYKPVNTGPARFAGVELAASADLARVVEMRAAWTRTESLREETGAPLPGRPRDRIFGRVAGRIGGGTIEPFAEAAWTSASYVDSHANLAMPAGEVLTAGLTVHRTRGLVRGLSLTAEATNLTDSEVRDLRFLPQPGRTFWLTVRWRATSPQHDASTENRP